MRGERRRTDYADGFGLSRHGCEELASSSSRKKGKFCQSEFSVEKRAKGKTSSVASVEIFPVLTWCIPTIRGNFKRKETSGGER